MNISIIIPTLNEETTIAHTLENLSIFHRPHEIILVDGGSQDQTVPIASKWAKVISSDQGRARQMNVGAKEARGDVLLFLHADTKLPENGLELIVESIQKKHDQAGRFRLRFDEKKWSLKLFASYTRFRFFSYGDQALFITKELFESLGGFREDVPFEDVDFFKRLSKKERFTIIKEPVVTSARRFLNKGCWQQKWINSFLLGLYYLGQNVSRVKDRLYPDVR